MHNGAKSFLKANYYFDKSDVSYMIYLNVGTIISEVMKYLVKTQINKNRNTTSEMNSPFFVSTFDFSVLISGIILKCLFKK